MGQENLTAAVFQYLQALDGCFENDFAFTETLPMQSISEALLGKQITTPGDHCNLDNLQLASDQLREALIYAINEQMRHGNKSISVSHNA